MAWSGELKRLFDSVDVSINRFCKANPLVDKGTLSRYLNGKRVPQSRWLLDRLLALRAEAGTPLADQARDHLIGLQLAALQVAHPHDYRIRIATDELNVTLTALRESQRHVRHLEEELHHRNRQLADLLQANAQMRTAWDTDRVATQAAAQAAIEGLHREVAELTAQLAHARRHHEQVDARCRALESLLDQLSAGNGQEAAESSSPMERLGVAIVQLRSPEPVKRLDGILALSELEDHHAAVHPLLLDLLRTPAPMSPSGSCLPAISAASEQDVRQAAFDTATQPQNLGLANANLVRADLSHLDFHCKNLVGANLTRANLTGADLTGVDLTRADLTRANLTSASLTVADLPGATLPGADLPDTDLTRADLAGANLAGANLSGANLTGANLRDTNLRDTDLTEANLTDTDLTRADLTDANLTGADLTRAYPIDANLTDANLTGANLTDANLPGAHLAGAKLVGAKLVGADLRDADLREADLAKADLTSADVRGSVGISEAEIRNAAGVDKRTRFP